MTNKQYTWMGDKEKFNRLLLLSLFRQTFESKHIKPCHRYEQWMDEKYTARWFSNLKHIYLKRHGYIKFSLKLTCLVIMIISIWSMEHTFPSGKVFLRCYNGYLSFMIQFRQRLSELRFLHLLTISITVSLSSSVI